ncbi:uncharacterized protein [Ptychodera flava]|uniref:uncharacterized protein n=1 Tax=Ptychodera flava TaxID=63121 RepID=UPI00396A27A8
MEKLSSPDWRLGTGDLIQQIAVLAWLNKEEDGERFYKAVTTCRVASELWHRLTGEDKMEALRAEAILGITNYIKDHPNASKEQISKEVEKHILIFAAKVEAL